MLIIGIFLLRSFIIIFLMKSVDYGLFNQQLLDVVERNFKVIVTTMLYLVRRVLVSRGRVLMVNMVFNNGVQLIVQLRLFILFYMYYEILNVVLNTKNCQKWRFNRCLCCILFILFYFIQSMFGEIFKYLYIDEEMRLLYSRIVKFFNYVEVNIIFWYILCFDIEQNVDDLDVYYLYIFVIVLVLSLIQDILVYIFIFQ